MHIAGPIVALIVAAGKGERLGGALPKQYLPLAGRPLLVHSIDAFLAHPAVDSVQVVIGAGQEPFYSEAIGNRPLGAPVLGGASRRDSVRAGLAAIGQAGIVLIHDAARPFPPAAVIDRLIAALATSPGAVPVLAVADSLARAGDGLGAPVDRSGVVRVQTPQAFRFADILAAHDAWPEGQEATDDAQVLRAHGGTVAVVAGDRALDKITFADDVSAAEAALAARLVSRTGMGFDVHAFAPGSSVWLGGIEIPHSAALAGHSDADVALHALTDALLGTIGAGDIGTHFPPSDPQWRGAASHLFLAHARDLIAAAGGIIDHADLTIICEAPKIGPYRDAIRERIASVLRLSSSRISIKATTTERLGFTGRQEGIAAQAIATVRTPGGR